eukprot:11170101-Lingulodinium_polyedra.AAC.1
MAKSAWHALDGHPVVPWRPERALAGPHAVARRADRPLEGLEVALAPPRAPDERDVVLQRQPR